ncbi:CDP-glycerol glycerophosphotransferase family protein [Microbacterium terrae]|uniref:CDP-glycerol:glycerophosphate glycerophosphotransferase n=1 Tax=Microbacterium terrae TaxID=69369 RepID=A0A0M2HDU5_9MICO|nr:CDP-glycerol glycerophosphotransferase family protein [Microbacterium terrae]KJL44760.1 putative CDP-glycerol:glycerophosphate glycerophosphotransferase [Microbacterium terrae]GLJ99604.1 teichoic acid biosynthesis protein [Microbacterium terrae]
MASFSFGAGNARKLASIPLYAMGRLVTAVVPRADGEWVFGCGAGIGDGALALWQRAALDGTPAVWLVGSERERADAAARGIPVVAKNSFAGFWRTARARVIVVTHGFGDVNRYAVSGGFVAQLWHGIPLKRIGLDSPATLRPPRVFGPGRIPGAALVSRLLARMYRAATRDIDLIPAASHLVRGRLESAFGLADARIRVVGEPRVDVLTGGDPASRRSTARETIAAITGAIGDDERLVLYAPTWRDGAVDPAVPSAADWQAIVDVLEAHDAVLLVRSHPLGAGRYAPPVSTDRVRALGSDLVADVTPVLPGLDVLVTDYSSLAYDSALVPLPVVFLAPDLEEYAHDRGFYGTYDDVAGPDPARDWVAAAAQLDAVLGDRGERDRRTARARALSERVHAFHDGQATERVYRAIRSAASPTDHPTRGHR